MIRRMDGLKERDEWKARWLKGEGDQVEDSLRELLVGVGVLFPDGLIMAAIVTATARDLVQVPLSDSRC